MVRSTEELQADKRNEEAYDKAMAEAKETAAREEAREELLANETDQEQRARRLAEGVS